MSQRYDSILEENANLKKALATSKSVIERAANDYETLKQIHEEYKIQQERIKKENEELNSKLILIIGEKKELENQFDTTIRNLKIAIEQKQREIEEIQQKVIPSFDYDVLRIKIINELDIPHQQQLEAKQEEIEKCQDQIYDMKNQIELMQSRLELQENEHQNEIKLLTEKSQGEISGLMNQIDELTERIKENNDNDKAREMKYQVDEFKMKLNQKLAECEDLRKDRDKIKQEKNESMVQYSKLLEQERNDKRIYKVESEKLSLRSKFIEEENKKNKIKMDSQMNDLEIVNREKENLQEEIRKKDELIHQTQRRVSEIEQENIEREKKNHDQQMKVYSEEHEKFLEERNIRMSILREFEQMKKNYDQLNTENIQLREKVNKDISGLKTDNMAVTDERDKLKRQLTTLLKENEDLQKAQQTREKQLNEVEREYDNVRKRYRDALQRLQQIEGNQDGLNKQTLQYTSTTGFEQATNVVNKASVNNIVATSDNNNNKDDLIKKLSSKNLKLKEKLKQANMKIMELLKQKLEKSQQPGIQQAKDPYLSLGGNNTIPVITQPGTNMPQEDDDLIREIQKTFGPRQFQELF